jgi:hypothetical protein
MPGVQRSHLLGTRLLEGAPGFRLFPGRSQIAAELPQSETCILLATGYTLLATGYWLLATGYWLFPIACPYWSSVNCDRRFCCQHASVWSLQNCFSLP